MIRYDDPVQTPVIDAVIDAVRATRLPVLLVFTGADLLPNDIAQERVRAGLRKAIGRDLPFVSLALPPEGMVTGLEALLDALDSFMPRAAAALRRADEARSFAKLKPLVLRYAAMAGASDVAPVVGMAAVPAAQGGGGGRGQLCHHLRAGPRGLGLALQHGAGQGTRPCQPQGALRSGAEGRAPCG
mgnify:CR=1 FL=1